MKDSATPPQTGGMASRQDPSGDLKALKNGWTEAWKATFGRAYNFRGAQDTEACKRLLKLTDKAGQPLTPAAILGIAARAWKLNGVHRFLQERSVQIASFASLFDQISLATGAIKATHKQDQGEGRFATWRTK